MKYLVHVNRQHEFSDEVYDTHIDAPQNNTSIISMNPSRISPVVNFKIKTKQVRKANGNPEEDSYFIGVNIHIKDDKK
jgi:hypothetical protein